MDKTIEQLILTKLSASGAAVTSESLAAELGVSPQDIVGAGKSLEADGYITSDIQSRQEWRVSAEGEEVIKIGSPEYRVWEMLADGAVPQADVEAKMGKDTMSVAMANGMKSKLFKRDKGDGAPTLSRNPATPDATDKVREQLQQVHRSGAANVPAADLEALKKRKLANPEIVKVFNYAKGPSYATERKAKAAGDLTREMLTDGSWKTADFKAYNFSASGAATDGGQLHPLLKVRQEFREIFLEMGFQEMETQHWVESSFWNFDSLFIPQAHPARDLQDTFFISKPELATLTDREYLARIKAAHETGFRTAWSEAEARRNVLRTHTTGSSSYTLYRLAQLSARDADGNLHFRPGRYYSIDRVFRNEQMDRTHLCEFHQLEGFVVGRDISLGQMMHTFRQFFSRIGIEKLRFKPTFNPYTEPSMEIYGYHTELQKWIEVGNSGLFRPELLKPLGYSDDTSVIAWGLSLERPTMIKYGIKNIHELFGHRVDLRFIKRSAIARF